MGIQEQIEEKLRTAFAPQHLEVIDESEAHRGHGGWREGGETHFRVRMRAASLGGQGRVAQQRAVYKVLNAELSSSVHALALELSAT